MRISNSLLEVDTEENVNGDEEIEEDAYINVRRNKMNQINA